MDALKELFKTKDVGKIYFRDIEDVPLVSGSLLPSFNSHIGVDERKDITTMPGINTPMYYVGSRLSYTTHHEEDGELSSLNVLRAGHPKVWFIISHRFRAEVEKNVVEYLKK